jgi:hypothetical protein
VFMEKRLAKASEGRKPHAGVLGVAGDLSFGGG